jgi:hypothetical protein
MSNHPYTDIAVKNHERFLKLDRMEEDNFQAVRYRIETRNEEKFELFEAFEEVDEVGVVDIVYEWKCHHKFIEIPKVLFSSSCSCY